MQRCKDNIPIQPGCRKLKATWQLMELRFASEARHTDVGGVESWFENFGFTKNWIDYWNDNNQTCWKLTLGCWPVPNHGSSSVKQHLRKDPALRARQPTSPFIDFQVGYLPQYLTPKLNVFFIPHHSILPVGALCAGSPMRPFLPTAANLEDDLPTHGDPWWRPQSSHFSIRRGASQSCRCASEYRWRDRRHTGALPCAGKPSYLLNHIRFKVGVDM